MRGLLLAIVALVWVQTGFSQYSVNKHVVVYKAPKRFRDHVPVVLSSDKKKVVSYPDPADIRAGGNYVLPALLHKGFMTGGYGIGSNSVFLQYTFNEYASLTHTPSPEELLKKVIRRGTVKEVCNCGLLIHGDHTIDTLNKWIDQGLLKIKCKVVK